MITSVTSGIYAITALCYAFTMDMQETNGYSGRYVVRFFEKAVWRFEYTSLDTRDPEVI